MMSVKMSKAKAFLFAATVFFTSFTVMWQMYEIVIVHDLYGAFPENAGIITAILGWPALITAVGSLLAGWLLKKISTKLELIIASALICVFGITAPFGNNAMWLLVCSFIMALAAGFANTAGMAIISEVYADDAKRSRMMGFYNAAMALLGAFLTLAGGILALKGWQNGFKLYWVCVPMLLMSIFLLPNIRPADRDQEGHSAEEGAGSGPKEKLGKRFWWFFASSFLYFTAYCYFLSFISVYVAENNLGDVAFTGTLSTLSTAGSFISGLVFGALFSRLRRKVNYIYFIVTVLCLAWLWLAPDRIGAIVVSVLCGICYSGVFTTCYAYASNCAPASRHGFVMGLMTFCYSAAIWLGVYLVTWCMENAGGHITPTYPWAIGLLIVGTIIEIVWCVKDDKEGFLKTAE
jgi:MFS family permease